MWPAILAIALFFTFVSAQVVDPRCTGARLRQAQGYLSSPRACYEFVQCDYDRNSMARRSHTMPCGCGELWSDDDMTCVPALDTGCPNDPCANNFIAYGRTDNCRSYFECDGSRTARGSCCDRGFEFDDGQQRCVPDADNSCTDTCLCDLITTPDPVPCTLERNPFNLRSYYETVHGRRIERFCARGVNFNGTRCGCTDFVSVPARRCNIDFNMICDTRVLTDYANFAAIRPASLAFNIRNEECLFNGFSSEIDILRFSNMDWRKDWALKLSFNGEGNQNDNAPLFSNSDCPPGAAPSIILRLIRGPGDTPQIEGIIEAPDPQSVTVEYRLNQRNDVYFYYNGVNLNLCVRYADGSGTSAATEETGLPRKPRCSVRLGRDPDNNAFTGILYEMTVHVFCVPDNFCPPTI